MASGTTITLTYVKDDQATKTLSYTVKYSLDGAEQTGLTRSYTEAVWVNDDDDLAVQPGSIDQRSFTGYRFESIDPEGAAVGGEVASGTTITLNYVRDDAQTQATSYTVQHVVEGQGVQKTDTYAGTAWVNEANPTIVVGEGALAQQAYEGYKYASTSPVVSEGQAVASGTTITLTYVPDLSGLSANGFEVTYDGNVHKVQVGGTILSSDTVEFWVGDTQLAANEFINVIDSAEVTVRVVRGGETWMSDPVAAKINPRAVKITVNDSSKKYGEDDPVFTGSIPPLVGNDSLGDVTYSRTNSDEAVGVYPEVLTAEVANLNGNYTYTVNPGDFAIEPADGNIVRITSGAEGSAKVYNGQPSSITAVADQPGSTLLYSTDGQNWSEENPSFTDVGTYLVYVKATHSGFVETEPVSAAIVITPAPVTIEVADASKVAGTADPFFSGTVAGLIAEGDLGDIAYVRPGGDEAVGVYESALTALYTPNGNYTVTVVPGTFTITAAPVVPPTPLTPPTPTPPTPGVTPGVTPEGAPPAVAAVIEALEDAVTPLAGPQEETIGDNENPLAGYDRVNCWVHYYLILGIIVTVLYGAGVLVRRINFTRKLKDFEDDVLGIEDESTAVPAPAPLATEGKEA